jgi:hypothetical protein
MGQIVKPFLLERHPSSGNEGNGCKPQGERLLPLIAKGEVEKDRIYSVIIIPGEKDLQHLGEWNFQLDPFAAFPFWNFKVKMVCFNPHPAFPS